MSILPRLALGAIQPEADSQAVAWALLDALEADGVRTQTFLSRACFAPHDAAATISGNTPRHLDSWLMPAELCRRMFLHACEGAEVAIVEGRFDSARQDTAGGSLDTLCQWLNLPRLGVVDCSLLGACRVPARPAVDALLLDRVVDDADQQRWQTVLESLWGIPVVASMRESPELRERVAHMTPGQKPLRELCTALGRTLLQTTSLDKVLRLATRRELPDAWYRTLAARGLCDRHACCCKVRVAVAYDEAFHCYFPDALDMLELSGAEVRIFSPLHDDRLPPETDIVYLGCGHPQDHAAALAKNLCMTTALHEHICAGRRVYAEGGGLAYLCEHVELADGSLAPMVGALRAVARRSARRLPPEPVEVTLAADSWLGPKGQSIRGYRNCNWQIEPTGPMRQLADTPGLACDLVGRHQVVGSRIHLNFAAQPALLAGFLRPCPEALAWAVR